MLQEPHCLNTSILDCSVTFTVDKDVWVHGIEVPSQVTDVPEELTVGETKIVIVTPTSHYHCYQHHQVVIVIVTDGDDGGACGGFAHHNLLRQRLQ